MDFAPRDADPRATTLASYIALIFSPLTNCLAEGGQIRPKTKKGPAKREALACSDWGNPNEPLRFPTATAWRNSGVDRLIFFLYEWLTRVV